RTAAAIAEMPYIFACMTRSFPSGSDRHLHEPVAPATLGMPRTRDSRCVVGAHTQKVLARLSERCRRRRNAGGRVDAWRLRTEGHASWPLMLEPRQGDGHA